MTLILSKSMKIINQLVTPNKNVPCKKSNNCLDFRNFFYFQPTGKVLPQTTCFDMNRKKLCELEAVC